MLYLPRGLWTIATHRHLWPSALVLTVVNILLVLILTWLCWKWAGAYLETLASPESLPAWTGWFWGTAKYVIRWSAMVGRYAVPLVAFVLAAWLLTVFPGSLGLDIGLSPVADLLCSETESAFLGRPPESTPFDLARFQANLIVTVLNVFLFLMIKVTIMALALPMTLIPVLGFALWAAIPWVMQFMDRSDTAFTLKGYLTREKLYLWRRHFPRYFGFGVAAGLFAATPLINGFFLASAVSGATLLYHELDHK
jgi:uncharacterized protein involved in cysteine biosynthesis